MPVIGCTCKICSSDDPLLTRTRSSIHLQINDLSILVDSGPDLREQALREGLARVDAVFYTHAHLDHITGFDELRAFCWHRQDPLPLYGSPSCLAELQRIFEWAFLPTNTYKGYIKPDPIEITAPVQLEKLTITPVPVIHGAVETHGYRFDAPDIPSIAYLPDVKIIPEESMHLLENIQILILDCLHERHHPTHMSLAEALAAAKRIDAEQTYFTHISHELDVPNVQLPPRCRFAHDGLKLTFPLTYQS